MKSRDSTLRMLRFQAEERRRQVGQIEAMVDEFTRMVSDLDLEIAAEQRRTGIDDEQHFAYSTFARAANQRRRNLLASIEELSQQLETAKGAYDLAEAEVERETEKMEREGGFDMGGEEAERAAG